jgi:hypothetical protein
LIFLDRLSAHGAIARLLLILKPLRDALPAKKVPEFFNEVFYWQLTLTGSVKTSVQMEHIRCLEMSVGYTNFLLTMRPPFILNLFNCCQ